MGLSEAHGGAVGRAFNEKRQAGRGIFGHLAGKADFHVATHTVVKSHGYEYNIGFITQGVNEIGD